MSPPPPQNTDAEVQLVKFMKHFILFIFSSQMYFIYLYASIGVCESLWFKINMQIQSEHVPCLDVFLKIVFFIKKMRENVI